MKWESVACCDDCWESRQAKRKRLATRIVVGHREVEFCHFCGHSTFSGIYVRVDTDHEPAASLRLGKEE